MADRMYVLLLPKESLPSGLISYSKEFCCGFEICRRLGHLLFFVRLKNAQSGVKKCSKHGRFLSCQVAIQSKERHDCCKLENPAEGLEMRNLGCMRKTDASRQIFVSLRD